jgi:hypothetical protein
MELDDENSSMLKGFRELPAWQKGALVATSIMTAPFMLFMGLMTALSLFPFVLFGRWEGDLGRAPFERALVRSAHHRRARTERYYRST